jgi:Domain of unknown function (DUF3854)
MMKRRLSENSNMNSGESAKQTAIFEGDYTLGSNLSVEHAKLIEGSAIAWDVAVERGYYTITHKAEADRLGFGRNQQNVPAIVIPVYSVVDGQIVNYQIRPDYPRIDKRTGKPIKYETVANGRMSVDVHPRLYRAGSLKAPLVPLFITEGVRKADAAISQDLCCISILGVWNWRGSNQYGGKTALPDWEYIALEGRRVYIVFDSDVMEKREVHNALARIAQFLHSRKADVYFIYLPPAEGGIKVGLDDFFAERIKRWRAKHEQS